MRRQMPLLGTLCLLAALLLLSTAAQAAPAPAPLSNDLVAYFPQTGHYVRAAIKQFFDVNGGVGVFGLPLTEVFTEDGLQVQYFERARFELHADQPPESRVQLTQIGRWFTNDRVNEPAFQWLGQNPDATASRSFFAESGHSLGGTFRGFWQGHGGLAAFGYPISEEFAETSLADGKQYTVQYFERARFELHADLTGTPNEVQLGLLGRDLLNLHPAALAQTKPVSQMVLLGKATTGFRTSATERESNIFHAAQLFNGVVVPAGAEYSFLNSGDFTEDGFVEGYGIIGGRLEKVVGGGLCQVSTTMYRAVSNAGLQITRRTGHSYVVYFYENILGFDATVFSPSVDFRWRNDTVGPVTIFTSTDAAKSTVTFELWGTSDGRTTTYQGPFVKNKVNPSRPIWQYDPTIPAGTVRQLVHGRPGMDVNYIRTVTLPNGTIKHYDDVATHYDAWADFYAYGAGAKLPKSATVAAPATR